MVWTHRHKKNQVILNHFLWPGLKTDKPAPLYPVPAIGEPFEHGEWSFAFVSVALPSWNVGRWSIRRVHWSVGLRRYIISWKLTKVDIPSILFVSWKATQESLGLGPQSWRVHIVDYPCVCLFHE